MSLGKYRCVCSTRCLIVSTSMLVLLLVVHWRCAVFGLAPRGPLCLVPHWRLALHQRLAGARLPYRDSVLCLRCDWLSMATKYRVNPCASWGLSQCVETASLLCSAEQTGSVRYIWTELKSWRHCKVRCIKVGDASSAQHSCHGSRRQWPQVRANGTRTGRW
jgi:hypothetical protein